jgi:hypothetical protein
MNGGGGVEMVDGLAQGGDGVFVEDGYLEQHLEALWVRCDVSSGMSIYINFINFNERLFLVFLLSGLFLYFLLCCCSIELLFVLLFHGVVRVVEGWLLDQVQVHCFQLGEEEITPGGTEEDGSAHDWFRECILPCRDYMGLWQT